MSLEPFSIIHAPPAISPISTSLPAKPAHRVLGKFQLDDLKAHQTYDTWGGSRGWLHFNLGVTPHLLIEHSRNGSQVLTPLLAPKDWPTTFRDLRFFVEEVLTLVYLSPLRGDIEVKLYVPFVSFRGKSQLCQKVARIEDEALKRSVAFQDRRFKVEVFSSGSSIQIDRAA